MADSISIAQNKDLKAETVMNIIEVLSANEQERLLIMMGVNKKPKEPKRVPVYTKADAMEYLHRKFNL